MKGIAVVEPGFGGGIGRIFPAGQGGVGLGYGPAALLRPGTLKKALAQDGRKVGVIGRGKVPAGAPQNGVDFIHHPLHGQGFLLIGVVAGFRSG